MPGKAAPGASAILSTRFDGAGDARVLGTGLPGRYDRWYGDDMMHEHTSDPPASFFHNITSARVFTPQTGASTLLLFGGAESYYNDFGTGAPFLQVANWTPGELVADFASSDGSRMIGSALLVHTQRGGPEFRLSLRDMVVPQWNAYVTTKTTKHFYTNGDPFVGWDAFPRNDAKLSPNNIYLTVGQAFVFDPGWFWANYNIAVQVWILVTRNSDGSLSGSVQKTAWWADDGAFYDVIAALLDAYMQLAAITINQQLATALKGPKVADFYYLPAGVVPLGQGDEIIQWVDTWDDVQICLEFNPLGG